jgi:hypothetical protein
MPPILLVSCFAKGQMAQSIIGQVRWVHDVLSSRIALGDTIWESTVGHHLRTRGDSVSMPGIVPLVCLQNIRCCPGACGWGTGGWGRGEDDPLPPCSPAPRMEAGQRSRAWYGAGVLLLSQERKGT